MLLVHRTLLLIIFCHRRSNKMMFKILLFVVVAFIQVAHSQQQGSSGQDMTAAQMWDPNTWALPYYTASASSWLDYFKKAQEASNQLYKQWDKTGAANMFATGMQFAQLAAKEAQKAAEAYMNQAQGGAMKGNMQG